MFERRGSTWFPAGMIASVEILSPTRRTTSAAIESARGSSLGRGLIFGPRTITVSFISVEGKMMELSSVRYFSGSLIRGNDVSELRSRGSVITPRKAEAAAVSGEQR